MRKDPTFVLALAVAFVLGLLPGLGVVAYQRQAVGEDSARSTAELRSRQAAWEAQKKQLELDVASAEATAEKLRTRVTSLSAEVDALKAAKGAGGRNSAPRTPPVIVERAVDGETAPGSELTLRVKVKGDADRVTMRLARIRPDSGWVKTFELTDAGVSGGVHTWKAIVDCPEGKGDYRYFADAYLDDTHVTMPGTKAYTFTVE